MKKNQIISRICIALLWLGVLVWGLFYLPAGVCVFLVLLILFVAYIDYVRNNKNKAKGPNSELNMEGLTAKYGAPDDVIVTNPTKGNDVDGCILVYRDRGFFVINGQEIRKDEITDVLLKNDGANPYMPADYQLHITTNREDYPWMSVSVGDEPGWANEALMSFRKEVSAI